MLEFLYHYAKFCGARISPAARVAKNVEFFTERRSARIASAVLATAIPSVCLSVCHTPVLYQNGAVCAAR